MLIDFHVHAFTDEIAEKAISTLISNAQIPCYTNGTVGDTRRLFNEWGVDYGVLLPIATKPAQQLRINNWAAEQAAGGIIPFGTVHPDAPDVGEELRRIKSLGLKGIKLHPDYQGFFLFEEKMKPIYKACEELGLPIVIHMGHDPVSPLTRHAMPYHLVAINEEFPALKIIGAHLGGMFAWEEVLHYVCGRENIWLDTSYLAGEISAEMMTSVIKKHGAEKILFASDCPWHTPKQETEFIETLPLSPEEKEKIYWKNAAKLLKMRH
ncbi:MAG: amidohydrolase family protein [Oscillospiraceae bacterium]|jgi:predicted TIM-barrel fold metal-dependent hydrolase|nr:amidohydrolase family protein [Oscillospiraceae bacterium]